MAIHSAQLKQVLSLAVFFSSLVLLQAPFVRHSVYSKVLKNYMIGFSKRGVICSEYTFCSERHFWKVLKTLSKCTRHQFTVDSSQHV